MDEDFKKAIDDHSRKQIKKLKGKLYDIVPGSNGQVMALKSNGDVICMTSLAIAEELGLQFRYDCRR